MVHFDQLRAAAESFGGEIAKMRPEELQQLVSPPADAQAFRACRPIQ
jgi:hypothetical protein